MKECGPEREARTHKGVCVGRGECSEGRNSSGLGNSNHESVATGRMVSCLGTEEKLVYSTLFDPRE